MTTKYYIDFQEWGVWLYWSNDDFILNYTTLRSVKKYWNTEPAKVLGEKTISEYCKNQGYLSVPRSLIQLLTPVPLPKETT